MTNEKTGQGQEPSAPTFQLSAAEAAEAETDALFLAFGGSKHGPKLVQVLRQKRDEWKKNRWRRK